MLLNFCVVASSNECIGEWPRYRTSIVKAPIILVIQSFSAKSGLSNNNAVKVGQ